MSQYDLLLFYAVSAIFIAVSFLMLSFDAVIGENYLQLVAAVATSVLMTAYVVFKYASPACVVVLLLRTVTSERRTRVGVRTMGLRACCCCWRWWCWWWC